MAPVLSHVEPDAGLKKGSVSEEDLHSICNHVFQVSDKWPREIVLRWLQECRKAHRLVCGERRSHVPVSRLRLIEVGTRIILSEEQTSRLKSPVYVALSYVWQKIATVVGDTGLPMTGPLSRLPPVLPDLIADVLVVCKGLGIDYLWVDKYCIDQSDPNTLHHQVHQMDMIYYNSELTIIAAYGQDERDGLPGVSAERRVLLRHTPRGRTNSDPLAGVISVRSLINEKHNPTSTIKDLQEETIQNSTWSTRAWTLQEALLSRRCLVFTQEQLYFECRGGLCRYEADPDGLQQLNGSPEGIFRALDQDPQKRLDDYCQSHYTCLERYSKRDLTKSTDVLHAFAGIVSRCQNLAPRIRQTAGVPFVLSPTSSTHEIIDDFVKDLPRTHLPFSLGWASKHSAWEINRPVRRPEFPSWSPAGWKGEISNTWWGAAKLLTFDAFPDQVLIENESGDTVPYQEAYASMTRQEANSFVPSAMHISSVIIPQSEVDFEFVQGTAKWSVYGYHADLRLCEGATNPWQFVEALKRGDFTLILLGGSGWWDSISERSQLQILSPRNDYWIRVGAVLVGCRLEDLCQHLKKHALDPIEQIMFRLK